MYKILKVLVPVMILSLTGCGEKIDPNRVDLEQFEIDNSNNYRYIFRHRISEEKKRETRYKKDDFLN